MSEEYKKDFYTESQGEEIIDKVQETDTPIVIKDIVTIEKVE